MVYNTYRACNVIRVYFTTHQLNGDYQPIIALFHGEVSLDCDWCELEDQLFLIWHNHPIYGRIEYYGFSI